MRKRQCQNILYSDSAELLKQLTGGLGQLPARFLTVFGVGRDLADVAALDADEDVLRLDVGVDDLALGVQVVEALENLVQQEYFL